MWNEMGDSGELSEPIILRLINYFTYYKSPCHCQQSIKQHGFSFTLLPINA